MNWQDIVKLKLSPQYLNKEHIEKMIIEVEDIRRARLDSHEHDREALAELLTKIVRNLHVLKTDVGSLGEFTEEFIL